MLNRTITLLSLLCVMATASAQDGPNLLQDPNFDNAASIGTVWTVLTAMWITPARRAAVRVT